MLPRLGGSAIRTPAAPILRRSEVAAQGAVAGRAGLSTQVLLCDSKSPWETYSDRGAAQNPRRTGTQRNKCHRTCTPPGFLEGVFDIPSACTQRNCPSACAPGGLGCPGSEGMSGKLPRASPRAVPNSRGRGSTSCPPHALPAPSRSLGPATCRQALWKEEATLNKSVKIPLPSLTT